MTSCHMYTVHSMELLQAISVITPPVQLGKTSRNAKKTRSSPSWYCRDEFSIIILKIKSTSGRFLDPNLEQ